MLNKIKIAAQKPTGFTALWLIGLVLMMISVEFMPSSQPVEFAWYYVVAAIGMLIELFAFYHFLK